MKSSDFDKYYKSSAPYFKMSPTSMLSDFLKTNADQTGFALDLGCGNGRNSLAIADAGYKCVGIDVSWEANRLACKLPQVRGLYDRLMFVRGNIEVLPFKFSQFNLIFCGTVLSCLRRDDAYVFLNTIGKYLSPGGIFLLSDFSIDDPGAKNRKDVDTSECAKELRTYFDSLDFSRELKGLKILKLWTVEKIDRSHGPFHFHNLIRLVARRD